MRNLDRKWSSNEHIIARTDPNGNTAAMSYDAGRRLLTTTAPVPFNSGPLLVRTTNAYDADGHLLAVSGANGASPAVTRMSYTATGQVQTVIEANGNVTTNSYDADDRLVSVTDPLFRRTVYAYDAMSRQISVSNPAIQAAPLLQQSYTPDGVVGSVTDANNNTTTFTPDGFDRLSILRRDRRYLLSITGGRAAKASLHVACCGIDFESTIGFETRLDVVSL